METVETLKDKPLPRRYPGFSVAAIGLLLSLPALMWGHARIQGLEREAEERLDRSTLAVSRRVAREVGERIDGYARGLEAFAREVGGQGSLDPAALQKKVTGFRSTVPGLATVYVGSPAGISIAVDPPLDKFGEPTAGTDYTDRDYYKAVARTGRTFISNVRMGRRSHVPQVQIAVPVHDAGGRFIAYLAYAVDLADVIQPQTDRLSGETSDLKVVVLDREGRVLAHPEEEARREMRNLSLDPLFQAATRPEGEIRAGTDERGAAVRAAVSRITDRDLNWRVVAYRPKAVIDMQLAAKRRKIWQTTGAGLSGILTVVAILLFRRPAKKGLE